MSIQNKKTLEAYQKVAKNYLESTRLANSTYKENAIRAKKELRNFIKKTFNEIPKGSKVLEVGSADGENAKYIQELGFDVTPSDVADDFLNAIKDNGLNPIKFNILIDDFKDKYYAIFCWRVFVHFTKKDSLTALKRSYEFLENNGLFILSVINRECKTVDNEWVDFPDVYHLGEERFFNYYSKEEMDKIISSTKFKIKDFRDSIAENGIKWLVYVLIKSEGKEMQINDELKKYIEEHIFPEYDKNEPAHGIGHIKYVIGRSFELVAENDLDVNPNIVYAVASYHDIGHHIDSKTHEIISADMMFKDENLKSFFSDEERQIIKEAIEDHRASAKDDSRSIYGRIVSSADRNNTVEACLRRTYTYGKKLDPNATDEELFLRAYDVLTKKFGENGYAKFYFKDSVYEKFLQDLRELLSNKDNYIETQRQYIKKLKKEKKL